MNKIKYSIIHPSPLGIGFCAPPLYYYIFFVPIFRTSFFAFLELIIVANEVFFGSAKPNLIYNMAQIGSGFVLAFFLIFYLKNLSNSDKQRKNEESRKFS